MRKPFSIVNGPRVHRSASTGNFGGKNVGFGGLQRQNKAKYKIKILGYDDAEAESVNQEGYALTPNGVVKIKFFDGGIAGKSTTHLRVPKSTKYIFPPAAAIAHEVSRGEVIGRKAGALINSLSLPITERAMKIGAPVGKRLEDAETEHVIERVAGLTTDLFSDASTASSYIRRMKFDGGEHTAADLIKEGRAVGVLSRLDELRFGSRG